MLRRVREQRRQTARAGPARRHPRGGPPAARHRRRAGTRDAVPRPVRRRAVPRGDARRAAERPGPRGARARRLRLALAGGAATFEQIKDLLRREVLDTQFRGMKEALENPDPEAMQRVKDMMADLNAMLAADERGEHTQEQFDEFMQKYGDMFPDEPAEPRGAGRLAGPPGRSGRADDALDVAAAARGAGQPDGRRAGGHGPRARDVAAERGAAVPASGPRLAQQGADAGRRAAGRRRRDQRAAGPRRPRRARVDAGPGLPGGQPRGRRRGGGPAGARPWRRRRPAGAAPAGARAGGAGLPQPVRRPARPDRQGGPAAGPDRAAPGVRRPAISRSRRPRRARTRGRPAS